MQIYKPPFSFFIFPFSPRSVGVIGGTGYMMVRSATNAIDRGQGRQNDPARFLAGQRDPPPPYHPHAD
jgi:hypothetical protein